MSLCSSEEAFDRQQPCKWTPLCCLSAPQKILLQNPPALRLLAKRLTAKREMLWSTASACSVCLVRQPLQEETAVLRIVSFLTRWDRQVKFEVKAYALSEDARPLSSVGGGSALDSSFASRRSSGDGCPRWPGFTSACSLSESPVAFSEDVALWMCFWWSSWVC